MNPSAIAPEYHGALDFEELERLGLEPNDVEDFSVNSNPFGPTPVVINAVRQASFAQYPDKQCMALRSALAVQFELDIKKLMVGNGTAELMSMLSQTQLSPDDKVVILHPTFGEYDRNSRIANANVQSFKLSEQDGFSLDVDSVTGFLAQHSPRVVHLCNPNNPTGYILDNVVIQQWAETHSNTLFIVDEAYAQFIDSFASSMYCDQKNIAVLRSMTKDYSLAGLRLGYIYADTEIIDQLIEIRSPWNVNSLAQCAGVAAIADHEEYTEQWNRLAEEASRFKNELTKVGYRPIDTPMHYFLVRVENAREIRSALLSKGFVVRLCDSYGLTDYIRISTQLPEQNDRFVEALQTWDH